MRMSGVFADPAYPAVHDHLAWTGHGDAGLARVARHVFGHSADTERWVLVSGDGSACGLDDEYATELASGRLVTMAARETYAPVLDGVPGAAAAQMQAFDEFVGDALRSGYSALRVVADNTDMLVGTDRQAENWMAWEQLADRWEARREVNGNCYFDVDRVAPDRLQAAQRRHPVAVGDGVPWRIFYEQDDAGALRLALAGAIEAFDEPDLTTAILTSLDISAASSEPLDLTLRGTEYLHHQIAFAIAKLTERRPGLRITDVPVAVTRLLQHLPPLPGFAA